MQHGLINCNEFYTANYWDEVLSKDLIAKANSLHNSDIRVRAIKELDRLYWQSKESMVRLEIDSSDSFVEFYRQLLMALNFKPDWTLRSSLEDGSVYTVFAETEGEKLRSEALIVNDTEEGEFSGIPICGLQTKAGESRDVRTVNEILDEEFLLANPPLKWALVCTPRTMFLAERSKWPAGRYLAIDWEHVFSQRSSEVYQEILGLCAREHLSPESGQSIHDEWDENNSRKEFAVTTALREAVRQGIEDLINEMIFFRRQSHQKFMPEGEPESFAQELTRDALFYVYRIIFLMYVEAQADDYDVLPIKSEIYQSGYSIEKIVEICQNDLDDSAQECSGAFIHETLNKIFALIWQGYQPKTQESAFDTEMGVNVSRTGFFVKGLKADIFDPTQIKHLNGANFRNFVLQRLIKRLAFSKGTSKKSQVGRISYAKLGINQLGAVYEGLLSYTGYFAKEPLVSLKNKKTTQADIDRGTAEGSIFLCTKKIADDFRKAGKYRITDDNFVRCSVEDTRFIDYPRGHFIYRLAGRDRQKLASYYTPESLTKLTVKYALKVLLQSKKSPEELLAIKILEPAMGSGAFLSEAVSQIAELVLDLELKCDPKKFPKPADKHLRLNELKYHLISKCVYGIDLNPTAVELAKISLWLGCLGGGKEPPDFSGRLKLGNSLVGARFDLTPSGIFPWLSLDEGMLNYGDKLKDYDPDGFSIIKEFRRKFLNSQLKSDAPAILNAQKMAVNLLASLPKAESFQYLKMACDLWCSLFFLNGQDLSLMPSTHEEFLALQIKAMKGQDLPKNIAQILSRIVKAEKFFHWDIEFYEQQRQGGFDLILANPPWVAVGWQDAIYVSDMNPVPASLELNASDTRKFLKDLNDDKLNKYLAEEYVRIEGYTQMLNVPFYESMKGSQKNTYKAFDLMMMKLLSKSGAIGVIQEDGLLDDEDGVELRRQIYARFRYHFQFQNELDLFADVHHAKRYSINVLGSNQTTPKFEHIGNLFLPATVDSCYAHDAPHDPVPMVKNATGHWETKGHRKRIVMIDQKTLDAFGLFLNQDDSKAPAFLNLHSTELFGFVAKVGACEITLGALAGDGGYIGSEMFHEVGAQDEGQIKKKPGQAKSMDFVVFSGPNIAAGNPLAKDCRISYNQNKDYDDINLEDSADDYVPRTVYQFVGDKKKLNAQFPELRDKPYRSYFRLAQRGMVNAANERCLFTALIPPGAMHINGIKSLALANAPLIALAAGFGAALVIDGIFRLRNRSNFFVDDFVKMPIGSVKAFFHQSIQRRALALNCLTEAYAPLWGACKELSSAKDSLISSTKLGNLAKPWARQSCLRQATERQQALIEIDALVALSFDLNLIELTQVYEVLFPVLCKYDRIANFDRKGKLTEAYNFFANRGW